MSLVHHELCFGCGRTNLFGLLLEAERTAAGRVSGRCFLKQDHQGAIPASAHEGVVAAALSEAMALACGLDARASTFEVSLHAPAPVGAFIEVEAEATREQAGKIDATARASSEGRLVGSARGTYLPS